MKNFLAGVVLFTAACAGQAQVEIVTADVDEVIARYIEAVGGYENIKAIQNLVYTEGHYQERDYIGEGDATMSMARPYFKLVGDKNNPGGYMEGYDGMAWEWFENPGVVIRTMGEPAEAIRHYAGVESPLVDYKQKGSSAKIIGETMLDERPVTVIQLIRRDGFVEQFYIDRDSFLMVASGYEAPIHAFGNDVVRLSHSSDYRVVNGIRIPHRFESIELPSGKALDAMQWGSIKANQDLPDDWFSPPDFERTPMQSFIEQLYLQRVDINAMMWIYHEFRLANPGLDTSDAANIAGFQSLKSGAVDAAIALLEQNARDNPGAVDARFSLGRAYRTAKRLDDARREFAAALAIDPDNARAKAALAELEE